jgi:membrane protease YdiL (CAAX protease family)
MLWAPNAWSVPLVLLVALGTAFCMIVPAVAYVVIAYSLGHFNADKPNDQLLVAQAVTYVPWAIFLMAVLPRVARTSLHELGFRKPTARDLGIALIGAVAMWLLVSLVGGSIVTLTHRHTTEAAVALLQQLRTPGEKIMYVTIAVVLAPMLEELTFRVFLFNALTRYMRVPFAALGSAIVFGLVHAQAKTSQELLGQVLTVSVPLMLGGIVLAYVYATTRCYWANVLTHGTFNAVTIVAVMFLHAT